MTNGWLARAAVAAIGTSLALMVGLGLAGPRAGRSSFPAAPPWPPWFFHVRPLRALVGHAVAGGVAGRLGLVLGLLAVRRGWRPQPQRLIAGSVLAVIALMVIPPVDNADPLYTRPSAGYPCSDIALTSCPPVQPMPSADPVRAAVPFHH